MFGSFYRRPGYSTYRAPSSRTRHSRRYGRRRRPRFWRRNVETYSEYLRRLYGSRYGPPVEDKSDSEEEATEEDLNKDIHVKKVDYHIKDNGSKHHTDEFVTDDLVVRRGQEFKLTLTFDRPYEPNIHDLRLKFTIGPSPSVPKGTLVNLKIEEDGKPSPDSSKWHGCLSSNKDKSVEVTVMSPADCIVGEWDLHVYTITKDKRGTEKELHFEGDDVIILFNPWCKDDTVYMKDNFYEVPDVKVDPKKEYILQDIGLVFKGQADSKYAMNWKFGQFDKGILDICLSLLAKGSLGKFDQKLGDSVIVSRIIAKMVNSSDDNGVLTGNWSGDYHGGKSPSSWTGTPAILQEYAESKSSVCFGQCWVFSAVTVTVCRALGIPCRSVTNFASAHDSNNNGIIEVIYDEDGNDLSSDSVWNFHVWNEVWMKRPDLSGGHDGWQIIDATPQEASWFNNQNVYTCGPSPMVAIKAGNTEVPYDTLFVFGEVNGDRVTYKRQPDGTHRRTEMEPSEVGKAISTKCPDGEARSSLKMRYASKEVDKKYRLDLTLAYKYQEGSMEERAAVLRATRNYTDDEVVGGYAVKPDFDLRIDVDDYSIGDTVEIKVTMKNMVEDNKVKKITKMQTIVTTQRYNGYEMDTVKTEKEKRHFYISPLEEKTFTYSLTPEDYEKALSDMTFFKVVTLIQTGFGWTSLSYVKRKEFRLRVPNIEMKAPEKCKVGDVIKVEMSLKNPLLSRSLTGCKLVLQEKFFDNVKDKELKDVLPGAVWKETIEFKAVQKGQGNILALFDCNEIADMDCVTGILIE